MGASGSQFQDTFSQILNDEPINSLLSDEIHQLTYNQFLEFLGELNLLSKKCLDSNGNQLVFAVKKDTDSTIFWKATVQIACVKINSETQKVDTFRLLSLTEFLKVFKTFKCQVAAAEQSETATGLSDLTISNFLDKVDIDSKTGSEETNECCICFERKQEIILPCAHSFCTHCIEEWNEIHGTCPICREKLESTDDTWVLSEVPKAEEISTEIRNNLMELTNDRSPPCSPS
ncbi:RING finger protein 141-like [Anoplophora glabripennis]|uniref:RING finger protein 141-like n=1 Tax=Anoplophora glabripennis TaxID=217634 RepID=UPI000873E598|nr:RING finger protein 141-like [Anoplophora glabripennis]